jgi:hypothetical protein
MVDGIYLSPDEVEKSQYVYYKIKALGEWYESFEQQ